MSCAISRVVANHSVIFIKTTNNSHGHLIFIVNTLSIVCADIETVLVAPGLDKKSMSLACEHVPLTHPNIVVADHTGIFIQTTNNSV